MVQEKAYSSNGVASVCTTNFVSSKKILNDVMDILQGKDIE